jgi:hypothetical protein
MHDVILGGRKDTALWKSGELQHAQDVLQNRDLLLAQHEK